MKKVYLSVLAGMLFFLANAQVATTYSFAPSSGTYVNQATSGVTPLVTTTWDDDNISNVALPFSFIFNGNTYTSVNVNTNGFISFGGTIPADNNYTPISTNTGYAGAIAGIAKDLGSRSANSNGGVDYNNGSPTLLQWTATLPPIGTTLVSNQSGIPAGATVIAASGTTVTMDRNATQSRTNRTITYTSGIHTQTVGSAPNRKFYIQWTWVNSFNGNTSLTSNFNFQIVLNETTNIINTIYGGASPNTTNNTTPQVGLRGAANNDYNNLTGTSWSAPTNPGGANNSTMTLTNAIQPASGQTFTWTPAPAITVGALTAFGAQCINGTYGPNTFTITGTNLTTADVTVGALSGYSYATSAGGPYAASLSLTQPGGVYSQTIYVQFSPVAVTAYNGNIVVGGGGAGNKNVAASGSGINTAPTVTAGTATGVSITGATVPGTITVTGCTGISGYGVEYSTTNGFANGTGTAVAGSNLAGNAFSVPLTGLVQSTTYYYHTYATNAGGTSYSAQGSFITPTPTLTLGTLTAFNAQCINNTYGPNPFTISGTNLTAANVTVAALNGYTYSTTSGGIYTSSLSLTQPGGNFSQTIYVRFTPVAVQSYNGNIVVAGGGAANKSVAAVGSGINTAPTVTSAAATGVGLYTATVPGNITVTGCTAISDYGIEYSTVNGFANGTGTQVPASNLAGGAFSVSLSGLTQSTTYYYHTYATNGAGTSYSGAPQRNFTTASPTITTGTIAGSPFCVTASTGAAVSVPFTSTGTFTGNTYTAQLSNAAGAFGTPINIGTLSSDANSGTVSATIPAGTATGTGYRIRVISSNPVITGSANTVNLTVNLAAISIAPTATQNINVGVNGTTLNLTQQSTPISRQWFYGTTSGGSYSTATGVTAATYTPNFSTQGTYYVVCISNYPCATITSNEVEIIVTATVTTGAIAGSPFCAASPISVPFTSAGTFTGNTYTAELSNAAGSFASPVILGTVTSDANSGTITGTIPSTSVTGTGYLIRVLASNPAITGSTQSIAINAIPVTTGITICQGTSGTISSATNCAALNTTAGPALPSTAANVTSIGNTAWTNTLRSLTINAQYASVSLDDNDKVSNYLRTTKYGFNIPAGATINGIQVTVSKYSTNFFSAIGIRDNDFRLVKNNVITGANRSLNTDWPSSNTPVSYGGAADLWGATWTPADINNDNFGIAMSVYNNTILGIGYTAYVDYTQITITYTIPGSLNWYTVSSNGTSIGSGSPFNPVGVPGSTLANTNSPGTYTFYAECSTVPGCRTPTDFVIQAGATAPVSGGDQEVCYNGNPSQTLTATATVASGETITWYDAPVNGNVVASPTQVGPGTRILYAQNFNGTCNSVTRTAVTLTITEVAAPISGGNQTVCYNGNPTQTLTATATGGTITWYDAASNGNLVASPQQVGVGTVTYYAQASNGVCPSVTRTAVTLTINPAAAAPTASNQTACADGTPGQTLTATATGGTITWYDAPTSGSIVTSPTQTGIGTSTYYAQAFNGTCNSLTRTAVVLTINPRPAANITSAGTSICGGASVNITGTVTASGAWTLTLSDGGGTATGTGNGTFSIPVSPAINTTYTIISLTDALCSSLTADLTGSTTISLNSAGTWVGTTSDWHTGSNWCNGTVPTSGTNVNIPVLNPGFSYPVISGIGFVNSLTIATGATLDITGTLRVTGNINASANNINATTGTIEMNGTGAPQVIPGAAFAAKTVNVLINNNEDGLTIGSTVNDTLRIKTSIGFGNISNSTINANGNLIITSTVNGTASLGKVQNGNTVTGQAISERFINTGTAPGQHPKSWQFVSANTTGSTIKNSWMESGIVPAGYGAWITDPAGVPGGFDNTSLTPSMKYYNPATDLLVGVTNPNTTQLKNANGYMLYVRGDRTVNSATGPNSGAKPTTLRAKGDLVFGTQTPITVSAGKLQSIGNPYPSAVDFEQLVQPGSNIDNAFYLWDPTLAGSYNGGGYQTFTAVSGWAPTPGGGSIYTAATDYHVIQSGQAFFVRNSSASNDVITFTEDAKVDGSIVATRSGASNISMLSTLLVGNSGVIADGNRVVFDNAYSNNVDNNDAPKVSNSGENFGLLRNTKSIAVEARKKLQATDTIHYKMSNLAVQSYRLAFAVQNMGQTNVQAELIDKFQNSRTPVSLTDSTIVEFAVTSAAASKASDRFMLVFRAIAGPLPVNITSIAANRNNDRSIAISWKVENEINLQKYEVERSADGRTFAGILTAAPTAVNGGNASYLRNDLSPLAADNFYRIKATSIGGQIQYSAIVKVAPLKEKGDIGVYPNPVTDKNVQIKFTNQPAGEYRIQLTNKLGQVVYSGTTQVSGIVFVKAITLNATAAAGNYQLQVMSEDGTSTTQQVIVQ